jgi:hypothetical protein
MRKTGAGQRAAKGAARCAFAMHSKSLSHCHFVIPFSLADQHEPLRLRKK